MGRRAKSIELTITQRAELENGYKKGKLVFSRRCHMVLLKSENRTSKEVANILGTNQVSVNAWLTRYEQEGIKGLNTKPGQGRKPILDEEKAYLVRKSRPQRTRHVRPVVCVPVSRLAGCRIRRRNALPGRAADTEDQPARSTYAGTQGLF